MAGYDIDTSIAVEDGNLVVGRFQDCTPIAEFAKTLQNEGGHSSSDFKYAAKLPYVMIEAYCNTQGITFADFMSQKDHIKNMLNDPALADFRIWKGKV